MPDLTFDLRYLRCAFLAAEKGSFRRAAFALELSQSTVTRRIQLLEHRLGFQLFLRDRKGVRLSVAGTGFIKDALKGAQHLDRAARRGIAVHRGEHGELRIGILVSPVSGPLHKAFRRFREQHPLVHVILKEGTSLELLHALAMGEIDAAFITGNVDLKEHNRKLLWTETVFAALPAGHRLAIKESLSWLDLQTETFVVNRTGPGPQIQDYLTKKLGCQNSQPRVDVHDVSRGSLFNLIAMNYGVTLATTSSVRTDLDGVIFRPIVGETDVLPTSVVWAQPIPAVQQLIDLAEAIARDIKR